MRFLLLVLILLLSGCWRGDAQQHAEQALKWRQQGEFNKAIFAMEQAIAASPEQSSYYRLLAELLLTQGRGSDAQAVFEQAVVYGEPWQVIVADYAKTLLLQNNYRDLLEQLNRIQNQIKDPALLQSLRGDAFYGLKDYDIARAYYRQALNSDPDNLRALTGLARLESELGNWPQAEQLTQQALNQHPNAVHTWNLRGDIYRFQGQWSKALTAYNKARELGSKSAWLNRAMVYLQLNQYDKAHYDLRQYLKWFPQDAQGLMALGVVHYQKNNLSQAKQQLLAALTSAPHYAPIRLYLGSVLLADNQAQAAEGYLLDYLKQQPQSKVAQQKLIAAYLAMDDKQSARRRLTNYLYYYPQDTTALAMMVNLQQQEGPQQVQSWLDRWLALAPNNDQALFHQVLLDINKPDTKPQEVVKLTSAADQLTHAIWLLKHQRYQELLTKLNDYKALSNHNRQLLQAISHIELGQLDQASKLLNHAWQINPQDDSTAALLATVYLKQKKSIDAKTIYQTMAQRQPENPQWSAALAKIQATSGDRQSAIERYQHLHQTHPHNNQYLLTLAQMYWMDGQLSQVVKLLESVVFKGRNEILRLRQLAQAQITLRLFTDAQVTVERWVHLQPRSAQARYELALIHYQQGSHARGDAILSEALSLDSKHWLAGLKRLQRTLATGQFNQAQQQLTALRRHYPQQVELDAQQGLLWLKKNNPEKALPYLATAWQSPKAKPSSALLYARALWLAKKPQQAIDVLQKSQQRFQQALPIAMSLAELYRLTDKPKQALTLYEKLLQHHPDNPELLNNLAMLLMVDDGPRSLALAEKARQLAPDNVAIIETLANAYLHNQQSQRAVYLLRQASLKQPRNPVLKYYLARALVRIQRHEEARVLLQHLLSQYAAFPQRHLAVALANRLNRGA